MKRDMDLVRELLLVLEADDSSDGWDFDAKALPQWNSSEIAYHLEILRDAGFVNIAFDDVYLGGGRSIGGVRITWHGQEFLADIKSDTVWTKTKQTVLEKVGSVSMTVMGELARHFARGLVGL